MPVGSCTHVLWDFNGTLLDDLDVAVAAVSDMLVSRGREPMTRAWYYELMEMPIIRYYEKLFDLSQVPFETLSREFVEGYARHFSLAHLAPGAREAVSRFAAAGCRQVVLSSFEQQRLLTILQELELADAFEAVIASIYLDGGLEEARKFVLRFIPKHLNVKQVEVNFDYKTALQEFVQRNKQETLDYQTVEERGPDHNKTFVVEVHLNSNVIGTGEGHSKKQAEQQAAKEALKLMGYELS